MCLSVGISHIHSRHWITNNILGIAFSIYGIENLHLSSFKVINFIVFCTFLLGWYMVIGWFVHLRHFLGFRN